MSFYLSPPSGEVPYHKLEEYSLKRLQFLTRLVACKDRDEEDEILQDADVVDQSECLIAGTTKDSASHHILRLILGGDPETRSFFIKAEMALFKLRTERMFEHEWKDLFKSLARIKLRIDGNSLTFQSTAFENLMHVYTVIEDKFKDWQKLIAEMCVSGHSVSCLELPFNLVLNLISTRQVNIHKGIATVPVSLLKKVFLERFKDLMMAMTDIAMPERDIAIRDMRIKRLAAVLKRAYRSEAGANVFLPANFSPLLLSDLWSASLTFPPCMSQLVKVLQDCHRLRHHDRIQLTLFLKDLGLSVHDALLLWKHEYSVPVTTQTKGCQHGWEGNQRRYIYNIRHLYGLEGSRINYKAHSCKSLQGRSLSCGEAGGCPFASLDGSALKAMLAEAGLEENSLDEIFSYAQKKHYGKACFRYLVHKMKKSGKGPCGVSSQTSVSHHRTLEKRKILGCLRKTDSRKEESVYTAEIEVQERMYHHPRIYSDKAVIGSKPLRFLTDTEDRPTNYIPPCKRKKMCRQSCCISSLNDCIKPASNRDIDISVCPASSVHQSGPCQTANNESVGRNSGINQTASCQTAPSKHSCKQHLTASCIVSNAEAVHSGTCNNLCIDENHSNSMWSTSSKKFIGLETCHNNSQQQPVQTCFPCWQSKISSLPPNKGNGEEIVPAEDLSTVAQKLYVKTRNKKVNSVLHYDNGTTLHCELYCHSVKTVDTLSPQFQNLDSSCRQTVCACQNSLFTYGDHSENNNLTKLVKNIDESTSEPTTQICIGTITNPVLPDRKNPSYSKAFLNGEVTLEEHHKNPFNKNVICAEEENGISHSAQKVIEREKQHEKTDTCISTISRTELKEKSESGNSHKTESIDRPSDYYWAYRQFLLGMKNM